MRKDEIVVDLKGLAKLKFLCEVACAFLSVYLIAYPNLLVFFLTSSFILYMELDIRKL